MYSYLKITVALSMVFVHLMAGFGFGIHECKTKGTSDVLLLNRASSCQEIHGICSCGENPCIKGVSLHDDSCCSTSIYHLESDYSIAEALISKYFPKELPTLLSRDPFDFKYSTFIAGVFSQVSTAFSARGGPVLPETNNLLLSIISFWRL